MDSLIEMTETNDIKQDKGYNEVMTDAVIKADEEFRKDNGFSKSDLIIDSVVYADIPLNELNSYQVGSDLSVRNKHTQQIFRSASKYFTHSGKLYPKDMLFRMAFCDFENVSKLTKNTTLATETVLAKRFKHTDKSKIIPFSELGYLFYDTNPGYFDKYVMTPDCLFDTKHYKYCSIVATDKYRFVLKDKTVKYISLMDLLFKAYKSTKRLSLADIEGVPETTETVEEKQAIPAVEETPKVEEQNSVNPIITMTNPQKIIGTKTYLVELHQILIFLNDMLQLSNSELSKKYNISEEILNLIRK